jgi:diguanylate cyclase (GGDEF)-like protein
MLLEHLCGVAVAVLSAILVVALVTIAVAVLWSVRLRRTFDERVSAAAGEIAGEWASRSEFAASLDPDVLTERALDEVASLPGVDAALMLAGGDGERRAAARGLSAEEADRAALQTPPNTNLRAIEIVYRYRLDDASGNSARPRSGVVVPLRADDQALGSLAALTRSSTAGFSDEVIDALEAIARRAGPALMAARRFTEARQLADIDSLTGLYNRRCFHEFLDREVARARRYERRLALVVLDLDNFKHINDSVGHLTGDAALAAVGQRILGIVRATDIACRFGGDEFGIILPESARADGELLADRIVRAIAATPIDKAGTLRASAGVAELTREGNGADLFERADHALYRAKDAGKARTVAS